LHDVLHSRQAPEARVNQRTTSREKGNGRNGRKNASRPKLKDQRGVGVLKGRHWAGNQGGAAGGRSPGQGREVGNQEKKPFRLGKGLLIVDDELKTETRKRTRGRRKTRDLRTAQEMCQLPGRAKTRLSGGARPLAMVKPLPEKKPTLTTRCFSHREEKFRNEVRAHFPGPGFMSKNIFRKRRKKSG